MLAFVAFKLRKLLDGQNTNKYKKDFLRFWKDLYMGWQDCFLLTSQWTWNEHTDKKIFFVKESLQNVVDLLEVVQCGLLCVGPTFPPLYGPTHSALSRFYTLCFVKRASSFRLQWVKCFWQNTEGRRIGNISGIFWHAYEIPNVQSFFHPMKPNEEAF